MFPFLELVVELLVKYNILGSELMFDAIPMAFSEFLQIGRYPFLWVNHRAPLPSRTCAKGPPLGGHKHRLNRDIVPTQVEKDFGFFDECPHSPPIVFIEDNFNPFS